MKALTLTHPWPWTFVELPSEVAKRLENRTWTPPKELLGQFIALHGGRAPSGKGIQTAREDALYIHNHLLEDETGDPEMVESDLSDQDVLALCIPGIFAVARLVRVVTSSDSPWFFGPFGWELEDLVRIEPPVPHKGAQGLWDITPEALRLVRDRYRAATRPAPPDPAASAPTRAELQADPQAPVVTAPDLPAEQRAQLIQQISALEEARGPFWRFPQVQDARRKALAGLGCAALWDELARAQRFYGRPA